MNNTKKHGFFIVAGLFLAITLLAACALSATLAMFYSKGEVTKLTVSVANWEVTVGGVSLVREDKISLSVDTDNITLTVNQFAEITAEMPNDKIAPGTWGYLEIPIVNNSDVDADVNIAETTKFTSSVTSMELKTVLMSMSASATSYDDMKMEDGLGFNQDIRVAKDNELYLYVCYSWPYEKITDPSNNTNTDENDTDTATSSDTPTLDLIGVLTITATQAKKSS